MYQVKDFSLLIKNEYVILLTPVSLFDGDIGATWE